MEVDYAPRPWPREAGDSAEKMANPFHPLMYAAKVLYAAKDFCRIAGVETFFAKTIRLVRFTSELEMHH
jgi:hypothetical protein